MIEILNKKNCSGCYACYNICPKGCIVMEKDNEGFVYPQVKTDLCIGCNMCIKTCPIIQPFDKREKPINIYACINNSTEIRETSSSGGVFYAIAEKILKNGGLVYGAEFNGDWEVIHIGVKSLNELYKLQGSKYSQSQINNIYAEIKSKLVKGNTILFTGTPCQVSGLHHYLKKKYGNLYTIEVLCHGVPSPLVWKKSLIEYSKLNNIEYKNIKQVSFRKKIPNMTEYKFSVQDDDNNSYDTFFYDFPFMRAFLSKLILRPSCYNCKAKKFKTGSDLIIGDLWNNYDRFPYNNSKGTNIVVVNTNKGDKLLHSNNLKLDLIDKKYINKNNSGFQIHQYRNKNRKLFFREINNNSLYYLMNKYSKFDIKDRLIRKLIKTFLS